MTKKFFKRSIAVSLLSLSICANSNYTHAAPPPETGIAEPFLNSSHLSIEISNIDNLILIKKASKKTLVSNYNYFLNSVYSHLNSDVAEEKKENYKKSIEELDLELKSLEETKTIFINRVTLYNEAKKIFYALSNQLVCIMQVVDPENMQSQNPEEYTARNRNLYSYVSSNTFINLDLTCNKIQNLIREFSRCNDSSLNQIVQYMKILHEEILTLNKNIKQSNYHTYSFIYVPKLELVNWINHSIYYSRCLESLLG